jgi:hypothetical protein
MPGPLDEQVKARLLDETRGNPLALMQLPSGVTPAELAGGFGFPDASPLTSRIEHSFVQRVEMLPRETQLLLLTAAAEPLGDVSLLWRAAERLGIDTDAGWPAEAAGLIEFGTRVRFPHPLVRSAVYRASDPSDRREVRRALADATDPVLDPDRRAWHRAHATPTPDEAVAAEMALSADRARGRGGLAAAAAFLQRAAELTPDPALPRAFARRGPGKPTSPTRRPPRHGGRRAGTARRAPARAAGGLRADRVHRRRGGGATVAARAAGRLDPLMRAPPATTYSRRSSAKFAGRLGTARAA